MSSMGRHSVEKRRKKHIKPSPTGKRVKISDFILKHRITIYLYITFLSNVGCPLIKLNASISHCK